MSTHYHRVWINEAQTDDGWYYIVYADSVLGRVAEFTVPYRLSDHYKQDVIDHHIKVLEEKGLL